MWTISIFIIGVSLILYSLSRVGLFSIAPVHNLTSEKLVEKEVIVDLEDFRSNGHHCLTFKFKKNLGFHFIIELEDAETGKLIEGREIISMNREKDRIERKYPTSYFGITKPNEIGNVANLRGADIPTGVKKLRVRLIPVKADGKIVLGLKTFRWCNN